jgi:hypothetical protein
MQEVKVVTDAEDRASGLRGIQAERGAQPSVIMRTHISPLSYEPSLSGASSSSDHESSA